MSKPWDKIRVTPEPMAPPIGIGEFHAASGLLIRVDYITSGACRRKVGLRFGNPDQETCGVCQDTARQLAEFFAELADQLEAAP